MLLSPVTPSCPQSIGSPRSRLFLLIILALGLLAAAILAPAQNPKPGENSSAADNKAQNAKPDANAEPRPLSMGNDVVGETLSVFVAHDPDCFNQTHLQIGQMGDTAVAGCDIETQKNQVLTLAGVQITKRHAVMDRNHVVSLAYEFKHHDYQTMRAAFVKAFGPPAGVKSDPIEGGSCERVAWKNEVSVVNLQECIEKGGPSLAAFGLLEFITRTAPPPDSKPPAQ